MKKSVALMLSFEVFLRKLYGAEMLAANIIQMLGALEMIGRLAHTKIR
jgi:hypothetical protein